MTSPGIKGLQVLVVEDSALVAMHLEEILNDAGCVVVGVTSTLSDAAEIARTRAPQLALLDINIRGEKVFPLARELQKLSIPIVFSSGYAQPMVLPPEFADTPYISKPFEPADLIETLRSAMRE